MRLRQIAMRCALAAVALSASSAAGQTPLPRTDAVVQFQPQASGWEVRPEQIPPGTPLPPAELRSFSETDSREVSSWLNASSTRRPVGLAWSEPPPTYHFGAIARGYLLTDSRMAWSGQETTFAAEGALLGNVEQQLGEWQIGVQAELFLNQPHDQNILVDTPLRQSFRGNFDVDPLEISQLHLAARHGDFYFALGKYVTPFGRFYFPQLLNSWADGPFIRTEAIHWRETGILAQYEPGPWSFLVSLNNGGNDRDTNLSKSMIARIGLQSEAFAVGSSVKIQDGIGSGQQKTYNSHVGLDALVRDGPVHLSAEVIYDQYGFRHPYDPLDITWGRSIYGRDAHFRPGAPVSGVGYYLNLGCDGAYWNLSVNYGEFYPMQLGDRWHDEPKRRGIVKCVYHWSRNLDLFFTTMIENEVARIVPNAPQHGFFGLFGAQFVL